MSRALAAIAALAVLAGATELRASNDTTRVVVVRPNTWPDSCGEPDLCRRGG